MKMLNIAISRKEQKTEMKVRYTFYLSHNKMIIYSVPQKEKSDLGLTYNVRISCCCFLSRLIEIFDKVLTCMIDISCTTLLPNL